MYDAIKSPCSRKAERINTSLSIKGSHFLFVRKKKKRRTDHRLHTQEIKNYVCYQEAEHFINTLNTFAL